MKSFRSVLHLSANPPEEARMVVEVVAGHQQGSTEMSSSAEAALGGCNVQISELSLWFLDGKD